MARRLLDKEKREIVIGFINGKTLEELAENFNCTKLTICRNLKKNLGEKSYENTLKKNNKNCLDSSKEKLGYQNLEKDSKISNSYKENKLTDDNHSEKINETPFVEIMPLEYKIDNMQQKDLSSVPISDVVLPQIVYMVVDKKIELEIKLLKDYPDWQFLSQNELNRKTIEIFFDLKFAKKQSSKEQKVIKVPNTDVFRIAAPILMSRGISRIVSKDILIAL